MPGTKIQNEILLKFTTDKYFYGFKENAEKERKQSLNNYKNLGYAKDAHKPWGAGVDRGQYLALSLGGNNWHACLLSVADCFKTKFYPEFLDKSDPALSTDTMNIFSEHIWASLSL